jgi:hypothetical protein
MANYYLNRIFPFQVEQARALNLQCVGDVSSDVRDEAQRGLRPYIFKDGEVLSAPSSSLFPSFTKLLPLIISQ